MNDQDLETAIKEVITLEQPCFVKQIAEHLKAFGYYVDFLTINRLLRGPLFQEVEKMNLGWVIKEDQTQSSFSKNDDKIKNQLKEGKRREMTARLGSEAQLPDPDHLRQLRTIMRLRSGLPPIDDLEHLTLGYDSAMNEINRLFQEKWRWIMTLGNYGGGKTHFLQVLRCISHAKGFATCFLSSDSRMSALNHPQRFLPTLLQTLELPAEISRNSIHGYENLISSLSMIPNGYQKIWETVNRIAPGPNNLFNNIRFNLRDLLNNQNSDVRGIDDRQTYLLQLLKDDLTGTTISHRGCNRNDRDRAYRLLLIARDLIMSMGCRGLVILIDEAESIFTKLPNILSRQGAVRVLSSLCHSRKMNNILTAVAMTPDGLHKLQNESDRYHDYDCVDSFETLNAFCSEINNRDHLLVDCNQIDRSRGVEKLLYRIRSLYLKAYLPGTESCVNSEWLQYVQDKRLNGLSTRLIVRKTIDLLDAIRFKSI